MKKSEQKQLNEIFLVACRNGNVSLVEAMFSVLKGDWIETKIILAGMREAAYDDRESVSVVLANALRDLNDESFFNLVFEEDKEEDKEEQTCSSYTK